MTKKAESQITKFRETARKHEADEDEEKFDDALRRVAKANPPKEGADQTALMPIW